MNSLEKEVQEPEVLNSPDETATDINELPDDEVIVLLAPPPKPLPWLIVYDA